MGKGGGDKDRSAAQYFRYLHLGFEFLLAVGGPTALGVWLDQRWGTLVLFTLLGLVLGFTTGLYLIYGALYGSRNGGKQGRGGSTPGGGGRAP